ncbi:MAG: hypothetical protein RLZZ329_2198, partial [Pseudomonadota bacterium]
MQILIFALYIFNQFIVLLMDINYENAKMVVNRVNEDFFKHLHTRSVRLSQQIISGIDIN